MAEQFEPAVQALTELKLILPGETIPAIGVKTGARGLSLKRGEVGAGLNTGARGFKSECTANGKDLLAFLATSTLRQLFDQGAQEFT